MPELAFIEPIGQKDHFYRAFLVNLIYALLTDQIPQNSPTHQNILLWLDEIAKMHREKHPKIYKPSPDGYPVLQMCFDDYTSLRDKMLHLIDYTSTSSSAQKRLNKTILHPEIFFAYSSTPESKRRNTMKMWGSYQYQPTHQEILNVISDSNLYFLSSLAIPVFQKIVSKNNIALDSIQKLCAYFNIKVIYNNDTDNENTHSNTFTFYMQHEHTHYGAGLEKIDAFSNKLIEKIESKVRSFWIDDPDDQRLKTQQLLTIEKTVPEKLVNITAQLKALFAQEAPNTSIPEDNQKNNDNISTEEIISSTTSIVEPEIPPNNPMNQEDNEQGSKSDVEDSLTGTINSSNKKRKKKKSDAEKNAVKLARITSIRQNDTATLSELTEAANECNILIEKAKEKDRTNILLERGILNARLFQNNYQSVKNDKNSAAIDRTLQEQAIKDLHIIEEIFPSCEVFYWIGQLYKTIGKRYQFSLDNTQNLTSEEKDQTEENKELSYCNADGYFYDIINKASSDYHAEAHWELAQSLEYSTRYSEALTHYQFAVTLLPEKFQKARVSIAEMQSEMGNHTEALQSFQSILEDSQFNFQLCSKTKLYYSMALIAQKMRDIPKAIEYIKLAQQENELDTSYCYDTASYPLVLLSKKSGIPPSNGLFPTYLIKAEDTFYFYDATSKEKIDLGDISRIINEYGMLFGPEGMGAKLTQYYPELYRHICLKHNKKMASWTSITSELLQKMLNDLEIDLAILNNISSVIEEGFKLLLSAQKIGNEHTDYINLGYHFDQWSSKCSEAMLLFKKIYTQDPMSWQAHLGFGQTKALDTKLTEALYPNLEMRQPEAKKAHHEGYKIAQEHLEKACELNPESFEAHWGLIDVLKIIEPTSNKIKEHFTKAMQLAPERIREIGQKKNAQKQSASIASTSSNNTMNIPRIATNLHVFKFASNNNNNNTTITNNTVKDNHIVFKT